MALPKWKKATIHVNKIFLKKGEKSSYNGGIPKDSKTFHKKFKYPFLESLQLSGQSSNLFSLFYKNNFKNSENIITYYFWSPVNDIFLENIYIYIYIAIIIIIIIISSSSSNVYFWNDWSQLTYLQVHGFPGLKALSFRSLS